MDTKDRFGACVICHRDLMTDRVVNDKIVKMWHPDKDETRFTLDDGSILVVGICKPCKATVDLNNAQTIQNIMKSVVDGWQWEVDTLVKDEKRKEWDDRKAGQYMDKHSRLNITGHIMEETEKTKSYTTLSQVGNLEKAKKAEKK